MEQYMIIGVNFGTDREKRVMCDYNDLVKNLKNCFINDTFSWDSIKIYEIHAELNVTELLKSKPRSDTHR